MHSQHHWLRWYFSEKHNTVKDEFCTLWSYPWPHRSNVMHSCSFFNHQKSFNQGEGGCLLRVYPRTEDISCLSHSQSITQGLGHISCLCANNDCWQFLSFWRRCVLIPYCGILVTLVHSYGRALWNLADRLVVSNEIQRYYENTISFQCISNAFVCMWLKRLEALKKWTLQSGICSGNYNKTPHFKCLRWQALISDSSEVGMGVGGGRLKIKGSSRFSIWLGLFCVCLCV